MLSGELVEHTRDWLNQNGLTASWQERIGIAAAASAIAPTLTSLCLPHDRLFFASLFEIDGQLNHRSGFVQRVHLICVRHLKL